MKTCTRIVSALALAGTLFLSSAPAQEKKPEAKKAPAKKAAALPKGKGAYATGKYRNLFAEAGYSQKDVDAKLEKAFNQLFHGDKENETVYFETGSNENGLLAYITDWRNRDARSEGMSYGMMIAVQMNKKKEFDAIWNWSKTYMYHAKPEEPGYKYFSWSMNTNGTVRDNSPAPDGEEYFAMALYFAHYRWGSGKGIYDYKAEADTLVDAMKNREVITGKTNRGTETDGADFDPFYKMVRFTPNLRRAGHTDPSYHLPAYYELWARWGPEKDRQFWLDAAKISRDFLVKTTHPKTGLAPNYANFDGTPTGGANRPSPFADDAWRTAGNWGVDWSWWQADPRQHTLADNIQNFFIGQGENYSSRFSIDGKPQGTPSRDIALVANNAITGLAATNKANQKKFIDDFFKAPVPTGLWRYYDGMWYIMGFLHCSGQFRIWGPTN